MSLIMDAQKAAQREKDARASGGKRANVPLLVPLKSKNGAGFNWQRVIVTVGVLGSAAAIVLVVLQQNRDAVPRALRTPGPTLVSLATPTPTGAAATDTTPAKEVSRVVETDSVVAPKAAARRPATKQQTPRRTPAAPRTRIVQPPPVTTAKTIESSGRIRVAIDEPRAAEAARLFAIAVTAHRAGDAATARSAYEQVLAIAPNDVDALNNLGVLHTGLREFDRAEGVLRRAIALAPANAGAWSNLGAVLRDRGRSSDAVAAFQRALSIDPHHAGARVGLAQQYIVIGSLTQARTLLEDVLRDTPTSPEASYALGQVLERQGDKAGAIRAYQTFVRFAPPAFSAYIEAVRLRIEALNNARIP